MKLSPSSLSLFKDCPRCFWLDKIKGISRPEGIFPSLPSGVDAVLKKHFDRHRARGEVPRELDLKDVKLFADLEKLKVWRSNFKGISFTDSEGNILHGAVDEILQHRNGKLIVLDFKTRGFPCKDDTHEHYVDQMHIYNYLLRKNNYETEDYSYLMFLHPKDITEKGLVLFNIELMKIPVDIRRAEQLWRDALASLKGKEPKASDGCKYCGWERVKG
jgi:RecB family exonuclease